MMDSKELHSPLLRHPSYVEARYEEMKEKLIEREEEMRERAHEVAERLEEAGERALGGGSHLDTELFYKTQFNRMAELAPA